MQVLIIDLGSQYTQLIGRRMRELGVRSITLSPVMAGQWLKNNTPKGIILSGGSSSIDDKDVPQVSAGILQKGVPVLGICLGMHWLVEKCGGRVRRLRAQAEYGYAELMMDAYNPLFRGMDTANTTTVWMSHGDSVTDVPSGFRCGGKTSTCVYAAVFSSDLKMFGVQFHPEVNETWQGTKMFQNFLTLCGAVSDYRSEDVVSRIREDFRVTVPDEARFLIAYSGGIDSTTLAAVLRPVLGNRLLVITLDAGNFRQGEIDEIVLNARAAGCEAGVVKCSDRFLKALSHTTDAAEKRIIFRKLYQHILAETAYSLHINFLVQGTLAPDVIESGAIGEASQIKQHHNVGFDIPGVTLLHPFKHLFKDEVRDIAKAIGLPVSVSERRPFPGPGLFCRIVGVPVSAGRLETLRWADKKIGEIVTQEGLDQDISQLVVGLGFPRVGVKGDGRAYAYPVLVRAVQTVDFMTCRGYEFPVEVRRLIRRTLAQHGEIAGTFFCEDDKPPATIELE